MKELNLQEKLSLGIGADFWRTVSVQDIQSIWLSDGPNGLRAQQADSDMIGINESIPATCFPTAVTAGATWNRDLFYQEGKAIGQEAVAIGVDVVLGPGCNIKRNPLCGRNFEYLSEDPYVSGEMAAAFIQGQQSTGVGSSLKHFAVNNQETKRFNSDSKIDERALREIYLPAFEKAVKKAHPLTVMCSYNKINGVFSSDNKNLLTDILRDEWGFDGLVVTDWGAMHDRISAYKAGCDLCMPGPSKYMEKAVLDALNQETLSEEEIDRSVTRLEKLVKQVKESEKDTNNDVEVHHLLAQKIAEQGAVLLKNEDNILPLVTNDCVLIGTMADKMRYQGAGSSHINPTKLVSINDAMGMDYVACCDEKGNVSEAELEQARNAASSHEVAIVVAGLPDCYESEGFDRENMQMPAGHIQMIEEVAKVNKNTVVVLLGGSAMEVPWAEQVKAILYMGLPGQAGGQACADLLTGKANPSGKLTESWPYRYEDVVSKDCFGQYDAEYQESIYVGYRYYDKAKKAVRYPFGYGLSYSTFEYSDLKVDGNQVSCVVTNTGSIQGAEVVQLYIGAPQNSIHRPIKELKGFERVELNPNESKRICFELDERSFALWHDGWKIINGKYQVCVGASSSDIRLSSELDVDGVDLVVDNANWYVDLKGPVQRQDWEKQMGHPVEAYTEVKKGEYTLDNSCLEMKDHSLMMKIQYKVTEGIIAKSFGGKKDYNDPAFKMMMICATDCPMHSVIINSNGAMTDSLAKGMVEMANGHFIKGLVSMIKK